MPQHLQVFLKWSFFTHHPSGVKQAHKALPQALKVIPICDRHATGKFHGENNIGMNFSSDINLPQALTIKWGTMIEKISEEIMTINMLNVLKSTCHKILFSKNGKNRVYIYMLRKIKSICYMMHLCTYCVQGTRETAKQPVLVQQIVIRQIGLNKDINKYFIVSQTKAKQVLELHFVYSVICSTWPATYHLILYLQCIK